MNKSHLLALALLSFPLSVCATSSYAISVNTSSISGVNGSLDFQLDPANSKSPVANVLISNMAGGVFTSSAQTYVAGDVTGGPLPSSLLIDNGKADNEVLDTLVFGKTLTFNLNFGGPAITSPTGGTTGGSLFTFYIYSDAAGTVPALTSDPNGLAYSVSVNDNGSLTSKVISPNLQASPEPTSAGLLGGAVSVLASVVFLRRHFSRRRTG